jgi:simple sugar transport system permease protein
MTNLTIDAPEELPAPAPDPAPRRRIPEWVIVTGLYVASIASALTISAILVTATGGSATQVFNALLDGAIRAPGRWGITLANAAPLLLVALGTVIAYRAGLVNIGQEGQFLIGAAATALVATRWLPSGGVGVLLLAIVVGVIAGGLWAGIAAALKLRKVPEVISTLLLVTVAFQLVGYLLSDRDLLRDRDPSLGNRVFTSGQLPDDTRLPQITVFGNEFPISVIIAFGLALVVAFLLARTVWGFRVRMLGSNARASQRAGVSKRGLGSAALIISGAFAGFAGALMLTGGAANYRLTPGFSNNFGWEGLLVALVAGNNPIGAIFVSLIFAGLRTGSGFLAATGVERKIVDVVQALLVLALLIPPAILFIRKRRRARAAVRSRT